MESHAVLLATIIMVACIGCSQREEPAKSSSGLADFTVPSMSLGPIMPIAEPVIENPEKITLGKDLFNDRRLSGDGTRSCSFCHDLQNGGDDGRRLPLGIDGQYGYVNTPTVLNASLNFAQFWDGRAQSIEEQITSTVQNPIEMDGDWPSIEQALRADQSMVRRFTKVYGANVSAANVINALATYMGVLLTPNSPFDRYLKGETSALDEDQRSGYELFVRLGCVSCHQGRNIGGNLFQHFGVMGDYFADRGQPSDVDLGRYNVTGREEDRYKFKVPSLRNVAETAPYFHDGSAATLEDAVAVMVEYQLGREADDEQTRLLVAFLSSLSGELEESLR
jgi:cytochrome c peroxidase